MGDVFEGWSVGWVTDSIEWTGPGPGGGDKWLQLMPLGAQLRAQSIKRRALSIEKIARIGLGAGGCAIFLSRCSPLACSAIMAPNNWLDTHPFLQCCHNQVFFLAFFSPISCYSSSPSYLFTFFVFSHLLVISFSFFLACLLIFVYIFYFHIVLVKRIQL